MLNIIKINNKLLLSGCSEGNLSLWNYKNGKLYKTILQTHSNYLYCFLKIDNNRFLTGGGD